MFFFLVGGIERQSFVLQTDGISTSYLFAALNRTSGSFEWQTLGETKKVILPYENTRLGVANAVLERL